MKLDASQSVGPLRPSSPFPFETDPIKKKDETFGDMLKRVVDEANELQITADDQKMKLALGEVQDIHEVMIAMEKAGLALQLTLEIRDRLVTAYETLMRTAM